MAQPRISSQHERLKLLLEINNAIVSKLDPKELFQSIAESLSRVVHHDAAVLCLYEPKRDAVRLVALDVHGRDDPFEVGPLLPVKDALVGPMFDRRCPVLVPRLDAREAPRDTILQRLKAEGLMSGCVVPLISPDRALGVVAVFSYRENAFNQENADLLHEVAHQIAIAVEHSLAFRKIGELSKRLADEKQHLEEQIEAKYGYQAVIGKSKALASVLREVQIVAPTDSTVLIQGETGTGKELLARAVHRLSHRCERSLITVNCAAIPTDLLESEFFGHEKGAFRQRVGRFELADGGTLFLDEVSDIPLALQPKLLRVIQERVFERVGGTRTLYTDMRLVAASSSDLAQMVKDKRLRSDLYYRLNVFPITVPPLRERREDIPLLAQAFVERFARQMKKRIVTIPDNGMDALMRYSWPGNVRELQNIIERSVILSDGPSLAIPIAALDVAMGAEANDVTLESTERSHILRVLQESNWVLGGSNGAAARLGLNRSTLQSKLKRLGIKRSDSVLPRTR